MSRRMERTVVTDLLANTTVTLLTCPAGHKYELVDSFATNQATPGRLLGLTLVTAGAELDIGVFVVTTIAGQQTIHESYEGVVLYEGDKLDASNFLVASTSRWMLTYIDVDFPG